MNIDFETIRKKRDEGWHDLVTNPVKNGAILSGYYSESNHFIYELLQNAEDANATKVFIEYHKDRIEFYHDGDPFTEGDVYRITDVLNSVKKEQGEDVQKIGHFGIGFKAVFKYTLNPRIYSDDIVFEIRNYLMPYAVEEDWDFQKAIATLSFGTKAEHPFLGSKHLTRIVIPFKKNMVDSTSEGSSSHIIEKLKELRGETLLFLSNVRKLYWIDKRNPSDYALASTEILSGDIKKNCVVRCKVIGPEGEHSLDYVHFNKAFKKVVHYDEINESGGCSGHDESITVNVAIAYHVGKKAIVAEKERKIYVFFPTLEQSSYPFLAHGSFETELSREKIAKDSQFNSEIWHDLRLLICESLVTLRDIRYITQSFIKDILMPSMADTELKSMVTSLFLTEKMLPDTDGNYQYSRDLLIPVPFEMANLRNNALFGKPLQSLNKSFVSLNDLNHEGSGAYFDWLFSDLKIPVYHVRDWVNSLIAQQDNPSTVSEKDADLLAFYDFMQACITSTTYCAGKYAGEYYNKSKVASASLKKACVILNADNHLVRPFTDCLQIYISAESKYRKIAGSSMIHPALIDKYSDLWDSMGIVAFDDIRYLKETIIPRYKNPNEDQIHKQQYVTDIRLILDVVKKYDLSQLPAEIRSSYILRGMPITDSIGDACLCQPCNVFPATSRDEVDMSIYMSHLKLNKFILDENFYSLNSIDLPTVVLEKIGVQTEIVHLHDQNGKDGRAEIKALNDYYPWIDVECFFKNANFIAFVVDNNIREEMQLAQKKSRIMLELLLKNNTKFKGKLMRGKVNGILKEDVSDFFVKAQKTPWLFDRQLRLVSLDSKFNDLDKETYKGLDGKYPADAFKNLGLKGDENIDLSMIKTIDEKKAAIQTILTGSKSDEISTLVEELLNDMPSDQLEILDGKLMERKQGEDSYDPDSVETNDFPTDRVKNPERLRNSVMTQVYVSDPVKYEMKIRSIRTSKVDAKYIIKTEYTNDSGIVFCQCCRKSVMAPEVVEIKNVGLELPQMHICLCSECANIYRGKRASDDNIEQRWSDALSKSNAEVEDDGGGFPVKLYDDMTFYFTQHHLLEVKTIIDLLFAGN